MKKLLIAILISILLLFLFLIYFFKNNFKLSLNDFFIKNKKIETNIIDNKENSSTVNTSINLRKDLSINFNKFKYDENKNNITTTVTIKNKTNYNFLNLSYTLLLRKDYSNDYLKKSIPSILLNIVDIKNTSDCFVLKAGETKIIYLDYKLPDKLDKGKYYLEFQIVNDIGRVLNINYNNFSILKTFNNGLPLQIIESYVIKKNKRYLHNSGVNYSSNEKIDGIFLKYKNISQKPITFTPNIFIYNYSEKGEQIRNYKEDAITIASNETKEIEFIISPIEKPGAYTIDIVSKDNLGNNLSIIANYRAVIIGEIADIEYLAMNNLSFTENSTVIPLNIFGSFDGTLLSNVSTSVLFLDKNESVLSSKIINSELQKIYSSKTIFTFDKLNQNPQKIQILIKKNDTKSILFNKTINLP